MTASHQCGTLTGGRQRVHCLRRASLRMGARRARLASRGKRLQRCRKTSWPLATARSLGGDRRSRSRHRQLLHQLRAHRVTDVRTRTADATILSATATGTLVFSETAGNPAPFDRTSTGRMRDALCSWRGAGSATRSRGHVPSRFGATVDPRRRAARLIPKQRRRKGLPGACCCRSPDRQPEGERSEPRFEGGGGRRQGEARLGRISSGLPCRACWGIGRRGFRARARVLGRR
jgi:hypothetical protein